MSQHRVAEPSENWKQLLYEQRRVIASGRVRVPTRMAGCSRGVKTFGPSELGLGLGLVVVEVEMEGNGGVCLEGSEWGEEVAVRGQPPWISSLIFRTLEFSIPTSKIEEGTTYSTIIIIKLSASLVSATTRERKSATPVARAGSKRRFLNRTTSTRHPVRVYGCRVQ